jgi:hypothetical protein
MLLKRFTVRYIATTNRSGANLKKIEREGLHVVMFYYYSAILHLGKIKENFSIVGVIYSILLIQGISRVIMCPTEFKMQPTIHFRISEKCWLLKLKYPAFLGNG